MYSLLLISILYALKATALPTSINNTNTTAPHDNSNINCVPATWTSIATFFIGNYFAHATTVKAEPGEGFLSLVIAILGALFFPSSGLLRGLTAIFRNAKFSRKKFLDALQHNDYQTAARAGALCMVVRTPCWRPQAGDEVADVILRPRARVKIDPPGKLKTFLKPRLERVYGREKVALLFEAWNWLPIFIFALKVDPEITEEHQDTPKQLEIFRPPWIQERSRFWRYEDTSLEYVLPTTTIQGFHDFKDQGSQYAIAHVPMDAVIQVPQRTELSPDQNTANTTRDSTNPGFVSGSFSIPKALVAIFQLCYAILTLYRSISTEMNKYGYAAFSLSVLPYAIMSLFNLLGGLFAPEYSALTMVHSDVMDEAIKRGAQFDGVMGRLVPVTDQKTAKIKVLPPITKDQESSSSRFSYTRHKETDEFPVTIAEVYRNPSMPPFIEGTNVSTTMLERGSDIPHLPATILVPTHSKFRRIETYPTDLDTNVTYLTNLNVSTFKGYSEPNPIYYTTHLACLLYGGLVFGIIGGISKFEKGESTHSQRVWLMLWYSWGIVMGIVRQDRTYKEYSSVASLLTTFAFCAPAIGGLVVVGQMMKAYGTCTVAF